MPKIGPIITTYTGRNFSPQNPDPRDVSLDDVSRGMSAIRFGHHTRDPGKCAHPLSVRSHSMRVARLLWWSAPADNRRAAVDALAGLLHDAGEGYVGDRLSPIKTEVDEAMERAVRDAIIDSLGLSAQVASDVREAIESDRCLVADRLAASQEALIYQCNADSWALPSADQAEVQDYRPTRTLIAETLHLFYPRESEDWMDAVNYLSALDRSWFDVEIAEAMLGIGVP